MESDSFKSTEQSPINETEFDLSQQLKKQQYQMVQNGSYQYKNEQPQIQQQVDQVDVVDRVDESDKYRMNQQEMVETILVQQQTQQKLIEQLKVLESEKQILKQKLNDSEKVNNINKMEYEDQIKNVYNDNVEIDQNEQYNFNDEMDDIRYLVKDNDTGAKFNIKKIEQNQSLYDQIDKNDDQNKWEDYWDKMKILNNRFIDCIETNKQRRLKRILENQIYPIQIDRQIIDGQTGLHIASNDNNLDIVKVLLDNHANVNILNKQGQNALHLVARRGNLEIAKLLIINQINMNQQDKDQNTPLHICSEYNHKDMVELLIYQDNISLEIKNNKNLRPIDLSNSQKVIDMYYTKGLTIDPIILKQKKLNQGKQKGENNNNHYQIQFQSSEHNVFQKIKQAFYGIIGKESNKNDNELSIDDFIFYKKLGQGSFGEVYLVKFKRNKQLYAMKILQKQKVIQSNQIRYAMTEKNVLQIMKHPLIVNLNYAFQTKNKLIMVMDYCPKGDLARLLQNYVRIPEKYAKIYIGEILLALEMLHQESIVF